MKPDQLVQRIKACLLSTTGERPSRAQQLPNGPGDGYCVARFSAGGIAVAGTATLRLFKTHQKLLLIAAFFLTCVTESRAQELQPIFNGKDLAGWKAPEPNPFWKVVDGVLVGENDEKLKGHILVTERAYTNFVLELEVRWSGEIDSGVMLRNPELQVQFGISRSLKRDMTGAFYLAKSSINPQSGYPEAGWPKNLDKLFKPDDWNKFRIEARGDTFTVWLNGEQVTQFTDARYSGAAPIGLQVHPGLKMKVEFRNVRARALE